MMDLNKYIVNPTSCTPLHSTGYADVASGNRVGSVNPVSFDVRRKIEHGRQSVGAYNRSIIGNTYGVERASATLSGTGGVAPRQGTPQASARAPISTSGRTYNPFA